MKIKIEKCLNPKCKRSADARGVCLFCYQSAKRYISLGLTTWNKLEAKGKVRRKRKTKLKGRVNAKDWFLSNS